MEPNTKYFSYPNYSLIRTLGLLELAKGVRVIEVGLYFKTWTGTGLVTTITNKFWNCSGYV